jgi:hypothetical protein
MTAVTKDLVSDLLESRWSGKFDIWDFIDFVNENEPGITLTEFKERLWDHIYYNNSYVKEDDTAVIHSFIVVKPDETA